MGLKDRDASGPQGQNSEGGTAGLRRAPPVRPARLLGGAATCPSAFTPFLKRLEGPELVSRDVFFIDLGNSLSLVNPPILNNGTL